MLCSFTAASECLRQFSSSLLAKSSCACAPRLSLRASAAAIWPAHWASSCKSRFHQITVPDERPVRDLKIFFTAMDFIFSNPAAKVPEARKTAASDCMVFCISRRSSAVGVYLCGANRQNDRVLFQYLRHLAYQPVHHGRRFYLL